MNSKTILFPLLVLSLLGNSSLLEANSSATPRSFSQDGQASISNCDTSYVTLNGTAISVAPTGSEDTSNIQCALEAAVEGGYPLVRLKEGIFYSSNVTVKNFNGVLQGLNKTDTVLVALDGAFQCAELAQGSDSQQAWVGLLTFQLGEPQVKFMTIRADQPCVAGSGALKSYFFSMVEFTNDAADCTKRVSFSKVDRVRFEASAVGDAETSIRGVRLEADKGCLGQPLLGKSLINRSEFSDLDSGIVSGMGAKAQVDITFNTFSESKYSVVLYRANQITNILSNVFNVDNAKNYFVQAAIWLADSQRVNRTVIDDNTFNIVNVGDGRASYMSAFSVTRDPREDRGSSSILVSNNRFNLDSPISPVIRVVDTDSGVISGNTFSGSLSEGGEGYVLYTQNDHFTDSVDGWAVVDNDFSGLSPCIGYLSSSTTNMILGPNQGCDIIDDGSNNYFLDQLESTSSD